MRDLLMTTFHAPSRTRLRYGIVERVGGRWQQPLLASPDAELVFLLDIAWADGLALPSLTGEIVLLRGEEVRWRRVFVLEAGIREWRQAFTLEWRDRPAASTRLRVDVTLQGQTIAQATVLLAPMGIDAQGRWQDSSLTAMSEATQMAYADQFRRWTTTDS